MLNIQIPTLLIIFFVLCCVSSEAQAESEVRRLSSIEECYAEYARKTDAGHKSFALAVDIPHFICGFTWGAPSHKLAVETALYFCETARIHPNAETNKMRNVMTHCRIYASDLVE